MTHDQRLYRPCVGMVLLKENKVWVGHRAGGKKSVDANNDPFWQMPQGGIDEGESAREAAYRELYEEIGVHPDALVLLHESMDWFLYDFPDTMTSKMAQKYRGQKQIWIAFHFIGDDAVFDLDGEKRGHGTEFDAFKWVDIEQVLELVVPFKRDVYRQVVEKFRYLIDDSPIGA